jgi:hypothetical protein
VIWLFSRWEARRQDRGEEPLVRPGMLRNRQLSGGLTMFFFQYLVQAGLFFVVPLYLSVYSASPRSQPALGSYRSRSRCSPLRSEFPGSSPMSRRGWSSAAGCSRCSPGRWCCSQR